MAVIKELDLITSEDKSCHVVLLGESDRSGTVMFLYSYSVSAHMKSGLH